MKVGPVQYARNGAVRLAYRVLGEADTPLVFVPGSISNVDNYDNPADGATALAERRDRGTHTLKGVTDDWQLFRVTGGGDGSRG